MRTRRVRPECESLEEKVLLSAAGMPSQLKAMLHAPMVRSSQDPAMHKGQMAKPHALKGVAISGTSSIQANGDVEGLQALASGNNLVLFLAQFAALSGTNPSTRQLATSILNDARNVDQSLDAFAGGLSITLPGGVAGSDQTLAKQMISAGRSRGTDQAFSSLIVLAETNLINRLQGLANGAQDASIRAQASGLLPTVQADLAAAQGAGSLAPVGSTATSTTLSTSDLSTLSTYYSINAMERFLGQLTLLVTRRPDVAQYSAKLIGDHEGAMTTLGAYATSTGTYLPASIPSADAPMARDIVDSLGPLQTRSMGRYDTVYLRQMIKGHTLALAFTKQVIATSQNPVLKQFASDVAPTIYIHRLAASAILKGIR